MPKIGVAMAKNEERIMTRTKAYQKRQAKATQHRRRNQQKL